MYWRVRGEVVGAPAGDPLPLVPLGQFVFSLLRLPLNPTLFPYTTLFRSEQRRRVWDRARARSRSLGPGRSPDAAAAQDRKSTRLNSSHLGTSYAVFCLKKNGPRTAVACRTSSNTTTPSPVGSSNTS